MHRFQLPFSRTPLALLLGSVVMTPAAAQTAPEASTVLPAVEVSAPRFARELYATPAAVSTIDAQEIQQGQQRVRLDESLNRVPGVSLQ
ncbi:TonB-dependent receptor, partial [Guyparkeria sp. 1SP6A2]|nr:TonB-dependent receptor [Guyparkeria sp. 1SP6A2]